LSFSYPFPGPKRRESIEFFVAKRKTIGSWARARNPARCKYSTKKGCKIDKLTCTIWVIDERCMGYDADNKDGKVKHYDKN